MQQIPINFTKVGIFTIILVGLIGIVLRLMIPQTNYSQTKSDLLKNNFDQSQTDFSSIKYIGPQFEPPDILQISRVEQQMVPDITNKIIQNLNLELVEDDEGFWQNEKWSLIVDSKENLIMLVANTPVSQKQVIDKNQTIVETNAWLKKLGLPENLSVDQNTIKYFEGEYELRQTSPGLATLIQLQLGFTINSYPLFVGQNTKLPYSMMFDSERNLRKMAIYPQQVLQIQSVEEKPSISIDKALTNIRKNRLGAIISANNNASSQNDLTTLEKAVFTDVQIEYRLEKDGQTALPYYRFAGKATQADQEAINVEVISPAIQI